MDEPQEQISPDGLWRWDGHNWQPNTPPQQALPPQAPYGQAPYQQAPYQQAPYVGYQQPGYPQQAYGYAQPQKDDHTLRNVLLILGLLAVLFVGGCVAVVSLAANEVSNTIDEASADDNEPGGAANPLSITEGEGFDVYGFAYQPGWTIGADDVGDLAVQGLRFQNNRSEPDSAFVDIQLFGGNELLATAICTSDSVGVGEVATLSCFSGDTLPAAYDEITIVDTF